MGAVYSYIRDTYFSILGLITIIAEQGTTFEQALQRINNPKLPCLSPTSSFWQQQPTQPEVVDIRSEKLPQSADIVIIGSGMSGASIAYTILHECRATNTPRKVTILEGRTTCSGATGRNGGHIKAAPVLEYAKFKQRFGAKSARKILRFCMKHLSFLIQLSKVEGCEDGEVREVTAVDAFAESTMMEKAVKMLQVLQEDVPEVAEGIKVLDAKAVQDKYGFSSEFVGAMTYRSGAMWPYRFVTSIYASLLSNFPTQFSIETNTMVQSITTTTDSATPFLLTTSRGDIKAAHVIHATDAFAPNLIPGLVGKLFPVRGHMSAQRPGKSFPDHNGSLSWAIVGDKDFDYVSQRPGKPDSTNGLGAEIMTGGGSVHIDGTGFSEVGQWHDDKIKQPIGAYLSGVLPASFGKGYWGEDADGSVVKSMWTGIMGFTADLMPLVGKLSPDLTKRRVNSIAAKGQAPGPSEWVSVGFNGSGMVLIWLSGVAVGLQVLGRENVASEGKHWKPDGIVQDWFPEEFVCTPKRVVRSSVYELPHLL